MKAGAKPFRAHAGRVLARGLLVAGVSWLAVLGASGGASAAIMTFGSPLEVHATLNTSENLNYLGTDTAVAPEGTVHTFHFGADTAIWNTELKTGTPGAPAEGQAVKIKLEGCAEPTRGGPPPLTQIHFQDITPLAGGSAKVNLTSQPFDIPVCGEKGASGATISTYEPINLCMKQGDYVDFNDEGGYVERYYRNGVPYRVLGSVPGSSADSFIKGGGTNNGAVMSSSARSPMEGFATNPNEELMLQVEFGTGPDATHICGGGTAGLPPPLPAVHIRPQNEGVNRSRITRMAFYCRLKPVCKGTATLSYKGTSIGSSSFAFNGNSTGHVPIKLTRKTVKLVQKRHRLSVALTVVVEGKAFTQTVTLY
jgi:hypothetical protein